MKTALIFGVTGQDGSYLAEFLLKKKYKVHGVKRKSSSYNTNKIDHIFKNYEDAENKIVNSDKFILDKNYKSRSKIILDKLVSI